MIEHLISFVQSEAVSAYWLGFIVSAIVLLISQYYKKAADRQLHIDKEKIRRDIAELSLDLGMVKISKTIESQPDDVQESSKALIDRMERQIIERVAATPALNVEHIKREVQKEMQEFKSRIDKIERRFPEDAQLEKISSINDAILSERIDQLSKKVDGLEDKLLSRWDVAITVSTIIGGIFAVVAATYGVINFITAHAKS